MNYRQQKLPSAQADQGFLLVRTPRPCSQHKGRGTTLEHKPFSQLAGQSSASSQHPTVWIAVNTHPRFPRTVPIPKFQFSVSINHQKCPNFIPTDLPDFLLSQKRHEKKQNKTTLNIPEAPIWGSNYSCCYSSLLSVSAICSSLANLRGFGRFTMGPQPVLS